MPKYLVTVPFAGAVCIMVKAESENAAISAALKNDHLNNISLEMNEAVVQLASFEFHEHINDGNVCNVETPDAVVEELEEEGDE